MEIHGLCLVKNEADVIAECLADAARWCDHIYVYDNGSTDGTWEIVQQLARTYRQIVPYKQDDKVFADGLRQEIFANFQSVANPDDWWCRLDADEFYVENPQTFLRLVPQRYGIVWYASLSYYFSTADAESYRADPRLFADTVPVAEKCRYYYNHWSEVRFVRHRDIRPWPVNSGGWPPGLTQRAQSCPIRILAKHYPYRSPQQIERRIATRSASAASGKVFGHEAIKNWSSVVDPRSVQMHRWKDISYAQGSEEIERGWESRVIDASSLHYDRHDGRYQINEDLMPSPGPARRNWKALGRSWAGRALRSAKIIPSRAVAPQ